MKKLLYCVLIFCSCLAACGKKENDVSPILSSAAPNPAEIMTGTLKGVITPAGAATDVTAAILVNDKYVFKTIKPEPDGSFIFKDLPKGSGGLSFTPAAGYSATRGFSITVAGGSTTDLGAVAIPFSPGSLSGIISPAGAVTQIKLAGSNASSDILFASADATTGAFKFNTVPVGTYVMSCTPQFGYAIPPSQIVTITTVHETDAGTVRVIQSVRGSISGTISPAGSVATVTANYFGTTPASYSVTPDASGNFKIPNVIAANYSLTVKPSNGTDLYAPFPKAVVVKEGNDSNVGSILLTATPPPYQFAAILDGAPYNLNSPLVTLSADQKSLKIGAGYLTLNVAQLNGPGEYALSSTSESYISYTRAYSTHPGLADGMITISSWTTKTTNGSGFIKITSIDQANKTISGTFECKMIGVSGAGGQKIITDGVLTKVPFE